ncbi:MAG: prepilin-type N-terminal cleavage/methylation domain-containing protein [Caulobacterales bacterium]|nr:prepilin-type N-terminal cleavage/methylation domain-containing protein [Caulobacterales bacterium]
MTARARPSPRRDAGFSLLEVLVSTTLLALVAMVAVGGARFGAAAWERSADIGKATVEVRLVQSFLARTLATTREIRLRGGGRVPPVLFEGDGDRLVLAGELPTHLAPPGPHLIELAVREEALRLRWTRLGGRRAAFGPETPSELLLDGVAGLELRYFGTDSKSHMPAWRRDWRERTALPQLVEVVVRLGADDRRAWAPVVARVGTGGAS